MNLDDEYGMETKPTMKERWHIGREIPATFLIVLAIQTIGIAIWFGITWAEIINNAKVITELRSERYTKDDAKRDRELFELRVEMLSNISSQRFETIETRLVQIQRSLERHQESHDKGSR